MTAPRPFKGMAVSLASLAALDAAAAPRHLRDSAGLPFCGGPASSARPIHPSKARRTDCLPCRTMYRAQIMAAIYGAEALARRKNQSVEEAVHTAVAVAAMTMSAVEKTLERAGDNEKSEASRLARLVEAALNCDPAIRPAEWAEWRDRAAEADRLQAAVGPVTILAVRPPDAGPRRSFLVGEIRLAVERFGGAALADLILAHLQAPPSLPKERIR